MRKFIFLVCLLFASVSFADDYPLIVDPVVNATPPGAKVTAGYFTLINETDKKITITDVVSPTITKVEMHLSKIKDGVASMEKQESISIEPQGQLVFEHGSYHLMLMELTKPLKENDQVDIILTTSVGEMLIEMPVKKLGASTSDHSIHSDTKTEAQTNSDKMEHTDMKSDEHSMETPETHSSMKKDGDAHQGETKVIQ